jgi:hypothetical protein
MIKKIKITESQFKRILGLLTETPFDSMVRSVIKDSDVIKITWGTGVNNFKVLKNEKGNIIMDNIDGSGNDDFRYLISFTSLKNNVIESRRVNKKTESDIIDDIKKWKPFSFTDVSDIQLIRDGKVIDRVEGLKPTNNVQQTKKTPAFSKSLIMTINDYLAMMLEDLNDGKGLLIKMNNTELGLCCVGRNSNEFTFEIRENKSFPKLDKFDTLNVKIEGNPEDENLYELNKNILKTSDTSETFSIIFIAKRGSEEDKYWINDIEGISITNSCNSFDEDNQDSVETEDDFNDKSEEELLDDGKEIYNKILSDKKMQKAFYSQPTFWQSFVAELKGEKPVGNGIITVLDIVDKYTNKQTEKKIGEGFSFNNGDIVKLIPLKPIYIKYTTDKKQNKTYNINNLKPIEIKISKDNDVIGLVLQTRLSNDENYYLRIVVLEETENPNIKKCSVSIGKMVSNNKYKALSETEIYDFKFLNSEGYKETKTNKK